MVDLVKIRKKAKARDAARAEPVVEANAIERDAAAVPDVPEASTPQAQPRPVPRQTPPASDVVSDVAPSSNASGKLDKFRETAGRRRENFLIADDGAATTDIVELLTFLIGTEQYAVPIEHLVEIITPRTPTPVPNADAAIVGIISLRGAIVTVIDVRRKLKHPASTTRAADARIIVAERSGETLGFAVDRVLRVIKVASTAIEAHPVVHASELSPAVGGVFRHMNALTILLDLDKLLA